MSVRKHQDIHPLHNLHHGVEWALSSSNVWHRSNGEHCKSVGDGFKPIAAKVSVKPPEPICAYCRKHYEYKSH